MAATTPPKGMDRPVPMVHFWCQHFFDTGFYGFCAGPRLASTNKNSSSDSNHPWLGASNWRLSLKDIINQKGLK
jgi:hypothetical protein